jgi:flagellin
MALNINTNIGALGAAAAASAVNKSMETSMERLSTGLRVNTAADDAAGVAIGSRLTAEIRGTNQAIRNAMDSQAMIDTAEGAHNEVVNILQRMRELSVQAANDTNNTTDRASLQTELDQLVSELDRIAANTTWAGIGLLNGAGSVGTVHTTSGTSKSLNLHVGSGQAGSADTITATINAVDAASLGVKSDRLVTIANVAAGTGDAIVAAAANDATAGDGTYSTITVTTAGADTDTLAFTVDGTSVSITVSGTDAYEESVAGHAEMILDAVQAKIDDGTLAGYAVSRAAGAVSIYRPGALSVSSNANAQTAIGLVDTAINTVNTQRASLGAISNRLESTVSNLTNIATNLEAGRSRIMDADFAAESTNLAKSQILQQASMAMLAQANASKQGVLQLLQG